MTPCTRPVANFTPEQLRFPPVVGFTVRADFAGGEISSDLGALLLAAVDRRIGLIDRLTAAITDSRHAGYIKHTLRDLLTQRVFQVASGYEDGNDANTLRRNPLFKRQRNEHRWIAAICRPVARLPPVRKGRYAAATSTA